jgi:hypothetical protein
MGNELGSGAEMRRLGELYRAMSDGELLRLAERPDDLTDAAQGVLRGEMASRGLKAGVEPVAAGFTVEANRFAADGTFARDENSIFTQQAPDLRPESVAKGLAKGLASLMVFHDAIAAGTACDLLEAKGFEIEVRDVAAARGGGSAYGGPPVALQVIVQQHELQRAMDLLQEKMGLFPKQEVEESDNTDESVDDGSTVVLGNFGHRADADEVARVLAEAGVWHRVAANAEGTIENDDCFTLEVKEIDLASAGEIVEQAMNLPEE